MNLRHTIAATIGLVLAGSAVAAPLELQTRVLKERRSTAADGTTTIKLVPALGAVPGDHLVYVLAYRNAGPVPLTDLLLDDPLPPGVAYRAPAEGSPAPELSVDGTRFGPIATLVASGPRGERPAGPDDVRHLRWRLAGPVASGAHGEVAFQAILK